MCVALFHLPTLHDINIIEIRLTFNIVSNTNRFLGKEIENNYKTENSKSSRTRRTSALLYNKSLRGDRQNLTWESSQQAIQETEHFYTLNDKL